MGRRRRRRKQQQQQQLQRRRRRGGRGGGGGRHWRDIEKLVELHASRSKGISNALLERLCKRLCSKDFKGVFAANKIPRLLAGVSNFSIIVNLGEVDGSDAEIPVGHFVCINGNAERILYIDPYGLPCMQPKVLEFLLLSRRPLMENMRQIQHFDSPYCGLYSVLFVVYFDKEASDWMKMKFNKKELWGNDKKCVGYLKRLL